MKRAYDRAFDPPAPIVAVRVRAPGADDGVSVNGKLDTGADLCAVPSHVIEELDLPPGRVVRAAGFAGDLHEVVVYRLDLEIGDLAFSAVEALATRRAYVIVGRSVLRELVLRLDGPKAQLELRRPRARQRR